MWLLATIQATWWEEEEAGPVHTWNVADQNPCLEQLLVSQYSSLSLHKAKLHHLTYGWPLAPLLWPSGRIHLFFHCSSFQNKVVLAMRRSFIAKIKFYLLSLNPFLWIAVFSFPSTPSCGQYSHFGTTPFSSVSNPLPCLNPPLSPPYSQTLSSLNWTTAASQLIPLLNIDLTQSFVHTAAQTII